MMAFYNLFKPLKNFLFNAFHPNAFSDTLPIMGKGMLGIFIATAIMVLIMYLLSLLTKTKN